MRGVLAARQVADEVGDVHRGDGAAVLGADLHGAGDADGQLAAVAGDVIVDARFDSAEQGGLAVVTAAYDQRDPTRDAHPSECAAVGGLEGDGEFGRCFEYDGLALRQRTVIDPAAPRQDGAVGDEGHQAAPVELLSERLRVAGQVRVPLKLGQVAACRRKHRSQSVGDHGEEHVGCRARQYPAPAGRQPGAEAGDDLTTRIDLQAGALEDLLTRPQDVESAAFAASAGAAGRTEGGPETAVQEVCRGPALDLGSDQFDRESGDLGREDRSQSAGRRERIALDMIDVEGEVVEFVDAGDPFVGSVRSTVYRLQSGFQIERGFHGGWSVMSLIVASGIRHIAARIAATSGREKTRNLLT